ncbi:hypothetical protein MLD38_019073 [Melastoma candidum]|uniref:Uncharacterized protein n=1 Tax=Melastoma candidum TaxID=119954 RepID=A0ACB9R441_9MYRT|nr:hypothetical protein MLD38_019073 [Melastoma candidum]
MAAGTQSIFLEDFGQKVDLTRRIREVLSNYPEGTTVLKEIIQNADDAGARVVRLCLDRRVHGSDSLLSDGLWQWQGPALMAYNDAVFTEEDFESISRIGGSVKHGQTWKTGRFGVGFNSVYHLTDLPSFVSGRYVVLFDPQGIYLPQVSAANPGKRIDFVGSSAMSMYEDQFFPYCAFGCDMISPFSGTLFRFPLRNADQAVKSKLSRQAYVEDDISLMFDQLYDEGVSTLLFLKSVLSIEMYIWDAGGPEPRKVFCCSVSSDNNEAVMHRQAFLTLSRSVNTGKGEIDSFSLEFQSTASKTEQSEKKVDTFYVVQKMASGSSRVASFAATVSKEYDIHLLPWASVAACISSSQDTNPLKHGGAFCFLPLPVKTGLPVHVNAYFEVSSNRRGIWYGDDMDRSGKVRSIWNRLLLEDLVAPIYTQLLLGARELLGPTDSYYSLWPIGTFEEPWSILVDHIYRNIATAPVLYSCFGNGCWISPSEAFLHDSDFHESHELGETLVQLGMPIVRLSNVLSSTILKYASSFDQKVVTPHNVRQHIKKCSSLCFLSKPSKLVLLEYCLEDLVDNDVGTHACNLPLLPLANGEFGLLSDSNQKESFFICSEEEFKVLEKVLERIIDHNIPPQLLHRLTAIAMTSKANITIFGPDHFLQFFPRFMPFEWKYKSTVVWDPGNCNHHPTESWFLAFWQYVKVRCERLSYLSDWPILPSISGHLHRPLTKSRLLRVDNLDGQMQDILKKIGCKILAPNFGVEHHDLLHYVSESNIVGVLESIYNAVPPTVGISETLSQYLQEQERDVLCKFILDFRWYIGESLDKITIERCCKLPIYRVHSAVESDKKFQYSDLENPQKFLPPLDVPEGFLGAEFVIVSITSEEEILSKFYGIKRMEKARFYRKKVLYRLQELQPQMRDAIVLTILRNLPQLCAEDSLFKNSLKGLEFVPTRTGMVRCPSSLYDPRVEDLHALLKNTDCFPHQSFQESDILDVLQGLGLRTSVSPDTVLESARQVERLAPEDPPKAYSGGKVLLSFLEANAMKWLPDSFLEEHRKMKKITSLAAVFRPRNLKSDLEKFWYDLRMICWCPVLVSAPFESLPWPSVSSVVAPPKIVRLERDMWLVSASMRILDGECSSTALSYGLGWSSTPGASVIAAQLLELGKNNQIVDDLSLRQELALAMPRLYSILTSLLGSDEMEIAKTILEGSRWIWVGDGFSTLEEVVLNGPLHLIPYIRVIPVDLAVFKRLFLELGVREFLKTLDYVDILARMAQNKGSIPLDPPEMRAAVLISQLLSEFPFQEKEGKIYLPDVTGRLFPANDLVYNDAPWLVGSEHPDVSAGSTLSMNRANVQKFVHGNISNDVAEKLGVCSFRRNLLAENCDSMNLSLLGAAEAFGQHEALTTRLKHILEMYADGPGILFELVQNAEDAGASEVTFLLDKTQYGSSSVLSPEMVDWQGPALCCYNDSVFSSHDLYAISRIGQESKLEKPFAVGRFGLGFNCVYHFTDIPAFVSGENIVMFDPHASNLPGISPSHPGLRIRYVGRNILDQFPDQFSPFLHFGCDLQKPFPGTLFRFPLRTAGVACRSQIKRDAYTSEDVCSLFTSFSEVVSEALLFLRNVKTISIFIKEGSGHEMQLVHRAKKQVILESLTDSEPQHHAFSFLENKDIDRIDRDTFMEKFIKSINNDSPCRFQKIVVSETGISSTLSHFWMTSECLGGGVTKSSLSVSSVQTSSYIPLASVAAHLYSETVGYENNGISSKEHSRIVSPESFQIAARSTTEKDFEGRAFCFLPLPISTGLPAHVNAYFELSSNRRDIWFGNDMAGHGKKRSDWNMYLLTEVAAPAYGNLLEKLASFIGPCDLFFSFWPTTVNVEPWISMVQNVYTSIVNCGLRVLYTKARSGHWIAANQAIFPDFDFHKSDELIEAVSGAGLPVLTVPKPISERFADTCHSLHFLTPRFLRTLLIRRRRNFTDRNGALLALEYCLSDIDNNVNHDTLHGLPLLPLANGSFTTFEKNGTAERIYVARGEEYSLLIDLVPDQLVDSQILEEAHLKLCDIAQKGDTNLSFLSCDMLERLFLKFLPAEWQYAKHVTWSPGRDNQPSVEWMSSFWRYLKSSCHDLSVFSKWPILPIGDSSLIQLVENSNVVRNHGWSENMSCLLLRVGCQFLRTDMMIEHPQLERFVQPATAVGILNVLLSVAGDPEKIQNLFSDASEGELHELKSFILQSKWYSEEQVNEQSIRIIKCLPVFKSYRTRQPVSLSRPVKLLKPEGIHDHLLNDDFVRTETEREREILKRYLGVREPSEVEFYKEYVLRHMSEFISQPGAIAQVMLNVKVLIKKDPAIRGALSTIPFVLAANGCWQEPSRLYDPCIPELQEILHGDFFPSKEFINPDILETLVSLGLQRSICSSTLLDSARSVSKFLTGGHPEAVIIGRKLMACLDTLAFKLTCEGGREVPSESPQKLHQPVSVAETNFDTVEHSPIEESDEMNTVNSNLFAVDSFFDIPEDEFWSGIKSTDWCPVCADPPFQGLPWLKPTVIVASPSIVRPKPQLWLVSATMYICDGECLSGYLLHKLGWSDSPSIEVLSTQLIEISMLYRQLRSNSLVESTYRDVLQEGVFSIYEKLQEYVGADNFPVLKSALDGVSWVWTGEEFVPANALAFDSPVKFYPYLYVVPSELVKFRDLLLELGVKPSLDAMDYCGVLQRLQNDLGGSSLSTDQLNFVVCILEAISEQCSEKPLAEAPASLVLAPDTSGVLINGIDLVYNDAPWIETSQMLEKRFIHPIISIDLARRLGIQSLRCLSFVDEETTSDLPCMDYGKLKELLALYGGSKFMLFDLLELADCCKAKKMHIIIDKRQHPCQFLMQHNLAEFQGPGLVAILEGVSLTREDISSVQLHPPWRLCGDTLNYGLGLLSAYSVCNLLSILSGGYLYMFDPRGLALAMPPSNGPAAKMFSLTGTNLTTRFCDQFSPLLIGKDELWSSSDSTLIRMPLSADFIGDTHESGLKRLEGITDWFLNHASRTFPFLRSVLQVTVSMWEDGSVQPSQEYSISLDSSSALARNPFPEKKWRKFQISRLFNSTNANTKVLPIDVNIERKGSRVVERWLVVLTLGSGQTRNMALDRKYLAYNLTPVAGIAAHISSDGHPVESHMGSLLLSPLPLSSDIELPVTVFGHFLVFHNNGRYLFKHQDEDTTTQDVGDKLMEAWNRELISGALDSYVELVTEMQRLRKEPVSSAIESGVARALHFSLQAYGDQIYSFWPRSSPVRPASADNCLVSAKIPGADWNCLVERLVRPFYTRAFDLPVWQLYSGNIVKASEGMFLSRPGHGVGGKLLPATVCDFVKERYPVFSVSWDLVAEIQAAGHTVQEIRPKMVRDLLRKYSGSLAIRSVVTYVDVLEYCLSDIELSALLTTGDDVLGIEGINSGSSSTIPSLLNNRFSFQKANVSDQGATSSGDALEMVTSLGKALFDFGRGVVDDIGRVGGPSIHRNSYTSFDSSRGIVAHKFLVVAAEVKGLPCPTATKTLTRLGTGELWIGNKEQQELMKPLAAKFIHPQVMDRSVLREIFLNPALQVPLKLRSFSLLLLSGHMKSIFHNSWVDRVTGTNTAPWFSWEKDPNVSLEEGPTTEWIKVFWMNFGDALSDLPLFSDWPLIPAFLGRPILCRVRERHLIFIPPSQTDSFPLEEATAEDIEIDPKPSAESASQNPYLMAFDVTRKKFPWLLPMLNQCNIPIFDPEFIECAAFCDCLPPPGQSLGKVIASKLVAARRAGYFHELTSFSASDKNEVLRLLAVDFSSGGSRYEIDEYEALRALPIYKTVTGSYTGLNNQINCMLSSSSFLKPYHEHCLAYAIESPEGQLLQALGIPELHDQQTLVRFGLPNYELKPQNEQEDLLIYIYMNWQDLQSNVTVVETLKETKFVRSNDEFCTDLWKPNDLFDPGDLLLSSIFSGERKKFPGERFANDGWLRILKKTGLRNSIEADVMLECARRVEYLGGEAMKNVVDLDDIVTNSVNAYGEIPAEIYALAGSVVSAVFANFAVLYSNSFCNALGKITFVPAEAGFPNVAGKKGGKRVLTSYSDAIILKDWPLGWSCAPILTRQNVIPPEYSWGAFYLRSPPAFSLVLKHLQITGRNGGEDTMAHWPIASGVLTVDDATLQILNYLDKVWSSLSSSDILELQKVAFIPVANGTRLVTASSLFVRLSINLSPFAFELPSMYLPFVKLLKELGLQDILSFSSAKGLLLDLQKVCGYHRLNPNQFRAVMEILHYLCESFEVDAAGGTTLKSQAIVPDDGCRLVHGDSCVFIDSLGSHYIKYIDASRLRFVHPDVPDNICEAMGLRKLSDVVIEEVLHDRQLQTLEHIGSISLAAIRERLLSRSLHGPLWTVLRSISRYHTALSGVNLATIQSTLESMARKLQFVKCLHTQFLLLPGRKDITRLDEESIFSSCDCDYPHRTLYYVNQAKTTILVAEPPSFVSVLDVIAILISHMLGSPIRLPIAALMDCPEGSESVIVSSLRICPDNREPEQRNWTDGLLGKEIYPQDALQVQLLPLRPFYRGEIVAWRLDTREKLRYGRVIDDVSPSAGQALYKFKVEIMSGVTELMLSSQVFSFRNKFTDIAGSSSGPQNSSSADMDQVNALIPGSSRTGKIRSAQPSKELQYGRVSPAEMVQAVQELLSAAGINMDVEKQSLLQNTISLQEQLKDSQAVLLLEQEKADAATKEADTAKAAWVCRVCLSLEVEVAMVPCGHVLCPRCSTAVSRCPFCRVQVKKLLRIYRP